jgi:predicted dehydrogenase
MPSDVQAVAWLGPRSPDAGVVERIIQSGKHVLLATETCLAGDDLEELVRRGNSAGIRVVVLNPERMRPSRQLMFDELRGTKFGAAGLIRLHRWQGASRQGPDSAGVPDLLVHDIDLVLWLKQQTPNVVFAVERQSGVESAGTIQAHLGFADGGMALIDYTDCLPPGDGYQSLSAICSTGAMYADDHSNGQLSFRGGTAQAVPAEEGILPLVNSIHRFMDETASSADWQLARRVAGAARRSIETGRAVTVEGP